jgi:two-component system, response regulator FlrC
MQLRHWKAMSSNQTAQQVLWMDPVQTMTAQEHAKLLQAGLVVQSVHSLIELKKAMTEQPTWPLVVLHDKTHGLIDGIQNFFPNAFKTRPLICRVNRSHLELAVDAMRKGAAHVLASDDWSIEAWQVVVHTLKTLQTFGDDSQVNLSDIAAPLRSKTVSMASKALSNLSSSHSTPSAPRSVVYVDPVSQHLLALAQRVAQANVTALIEGPTGAGKEILARVLHESSKRAKGPFVGLNCAALPEQLIDDMLFGHEKGAFTGAHKDARGLFEQANGGTIFLDEIGEMPMHLQAKLLRVLQERQLTRLGAEHAVAVDVRVIAATNKDLRQAIAAREFREDLYFRISTFKLRVPALRHRPGDILPLVSQLLSRHAKDVQFTVSAAAQAQLLAYSWPGNVRELENVVQRAVVLCPDGHIDIMHLMFDDAPLTSEHLNLDAASYDSSDTAASLTVVPSTNETPTASPFAQMDNLTPTSVFNHVPSKASVSGASNLQDAVKSSEHQMILAAIQTTDSRMEAAAKLGISPRTLRYKLAKLKAESGNVATTA